MHLTYINIQITTSRTSNGLVFGLRSSPYTNSSQFDDNAEYRKDIVDSLKPLAKQINNFTSRPDVYVEEFLHFFLPPLTDFSANNSNSITFETLLSFSLHQNIGYSILRSSRLFVWYSPIQRHAQWGWAEVRGKGRGRGQGMDPTSLVSRRINTFSSTI